VAEKCLRCLLAVAAWVEWVAWAVWVEWAECPHTKIPNPLFLPFLIRPVSFPAVLHQSYILEKLQDIF